MLSVIKKAYHKYVPKPLLIVIEKRWVVLYWLESRLFPKKMKLHCPCCGLKYKSFVTNPYLLNHLERFNPSRYQDAKQDVYCPLCRSMPRHRILALWCEKHLNELLSSDILYFSPEYSMEMWMKRKGIRCTTADLIKKTADIQIDIQNTGLPDSSFDFVIANHVLEHVDDFRIALKEVRRILCLGGSFICSFPMDPKIELLDEDPNVKTDEERIHRFGQNDHKRVFGMKADQFLREAGFTVEIIDGTDYPEVILPVVGPADYDMNRLFCCRK